MQSIYSESEPFYGHSLWNGLNSDWLEMTLEVTEEISLENASYYVMNCKNSWAWF